jgi:hypothetical protein
LIVYEMLPADFLACIQETFIEGGSIMIREWIWLFTKDFGRFYCHGVVMVFIEWELFHNKRNNLTVY